MDGVRAEIGVDMHSISDEIPFCKEPESSLETGLPVASHGRGIWIYAEDGREYLDGSSGAIVCNLGHGNRAILDAQAAQGRRLAYTFSGHMQSRPREQLREAVLSKCPSFAHVLFFNSGSEAVEAALRASRIYWQARRQASKTQILSRTISYHGITDGALRVSGHSDRRQVLDNQLVSQPIIPTSYCFRCPFEKRPTTCSRECASDLDIWINRIGKDNIAAFIFEPIVGASGAAINAPPEYYADLRKITRAADILLIADEVMTGFGRVGNWLGLDQWSVAADITVIGKGLGAGYAPISALLMSHEVWEVISANPALAQRIFGHTYGGNPVSCATALAVIQQIEENSVLQNVNAQSPILEKQLSQIAAEFTAVVDVRGNGFLWGLELARDGDAKRLTLAALECGLLVYPCTSFLGVGRGDAIIVAPPLISNQEELAELDVRLRRSLTMLQKAKV